MSRAEPHQAWRIIRAEKTYRRDRDLADDRSKYTVLWQDPAGRFVEQVYEVNHIASREALGPTNSSHRSRMARYSKTELAHRVGATGLAKNMQPLLTLESDSPPEVILKSMHLNHLLRYQVKGSEAYADQYQGMIKSCEFYQVQALAAYCGLGMRHSLKAEAPFIIMEKLTDDAFSAAEKGAIISLSQLKMLMIKLKARLDYLHDISGQAGYYDLKLENLLVRYAASPLAAGRHEIEDLLIIDVGSSFSRQIEFAPESFEKEDYEYLCQYTVQCKRPKPEQASTLMNHMLANNFAFLLDANCREVPEDALPEIEYRKHPWGSTICTCDFPEEDSHGLHAFYQALSEGRAHQASKTFKQLYDATYQACVKTHEMATTQALKLAKAPVHAASGEVKTEKVAAKPALAAAASPVRLLGKKTRHKAPEESKEDRAVKPSSPRK